MASVLDICNLSLARLGDDATVSSIDPPEGSVQAEHCARFYPIARDTALSMHDWGFATHVKSLPEVSGFDPGPWWPKAFALPADCLRVIDINDGAHYTIETDDQENGVLLTAEKSVKAKYVRKVTDPSRFSPLFVDAIAWLLASHIAGPLIKGEQGAALTQQAYQAFMGALQRAQALDLRQHNPAPHEQPAAWHRG